MDNVSPLAKLLSARQIEEELARRAVPVCYSFP